MGIQAVAVECLTAGGAATVPRCVGKLETEDGMQLLLIITNDQGYDVFKKVPTPFDGTLVLQASMASADGSLTTYVQKIHIPDVPEVTLRCGGRMRGPQDIELPAVVPFA